MKNNLFNSINTNRHFSTSDELCCIPLEEVEILLKKCAIELGMDYEPKKIEFQDETDKKMEEVKKWLKSSSNAKKF